MILPITLQSETPDTLYSSEFILSMLKPGYNPITINSDPVYNFYIYTDNKSKFLEEYQTLDNLQFQVQQVSSISDGIIQMSELISNYSEIESQKDIDDQSDIHIVLATTPVKNRLIISQMKNELSNDAPNLDYVDLFRTTRCPSLDTLTKLMKSRLDTEYIYSDDPVNFGLSVYLTLKGGL